MSESNTLSGVAMSWAHNERGRLHPAQGGPVTPGAAQAGRADPNTSFGADVVLAYARYHARSIRDAEDLAVAIAALIRAGSAVMLVKGSQAILEVDGVPGSPVTLPEFPTP